jgi:hypothetical protein
MATTYEKIQSTTISGSSTNTVTFSSIVGTYTDLRISAVFASTTNAQGQINLRFNSDTSSSYSRTHIIGSGSSASSQAVANQTNLHMGNYVITGSIITPPQFTTLDIFSYSGSTFKTCLITAFNDTNNDASYGGGGSLYNVSLWRNTAAITAIEMINSNSNYSSGSVFTLYGIKSA